MQCKNKSSSETSYTHNQWRHRVDTQLSHPTLSAGMRDGRAKRMRRPGIEPGAHRGRMATMDFTTKPPTLFDWMIDSGRFQHVVGRAKVDGFSHTT